MLRKATHSAFLGSIQVAKWLALLTSDADHKVPGFESGWRRNPAHDCMVQCHHLNLT